MRVIRWLYECVTDVWYGRTEEFDSTMEGCA